jgi:hypothetical protein
MKSTLYGENRPRLLQLLAKEYAVRDNRGEQADALEETAELLMRASAQAADTERGRLKAAVEALSGNRNTVVYDDFGLPSVMVRVPALRESDVLAQGTDALHPAFLPGEPEYLVGKYQSGLLDGQACSLPLALPLYGQTLDEAIGRCCRKGKGWHLTPFALRMAIALRCRKRGFLPRGNSRDGLCYTAAQEHGLPAEGGVVLSGSGPASWADDGTADGMYDLSGNLNEWDTGFRLLNGEIQIIPAQALLEPDADMSPESPLWTAISETGALVAPGTRGTLKYDAPEGRVRLTRTVEYPGTGNSAFADLQAEPGLAVPNAARLLGLYPEEDRRGYEQGWRWITTEGEGMPLSGGGHRADDHAGVFFVGATYPRTKNYDLTGFRLMYRSREGTR